MKSKILAVLREITNRYPPGMIDEQIRDIARIAFHIGLVLKAAEPIAAGDLEICDLGGGLGMFSVGCADLGVKRSILVDDFNDSGNRLYGDSVLDLHRSYGVDVFLRDVVARGISDLKGAFDVITTFDSMEHWHHSPKNLFSQVISKLKPGGVFVIGVPNSVNMRKRITVPLGIGKWSGMQDWYEAEEFRGHVREPDVDDLKYISRSMGLCDVKIYGRNWLGYSSKNAAIRLATQIIDTPLQLIPSLCSDIYLVGKKSSLAASE